MKKIKIIFPFFLIILLLVVSSCSSPDTEETKKVISISFDTGNVEENVSIDAFKISDVSMIIAYDNNTVETKPLTLDMLSETEKAKLQTEGFHTITVSYQGCSNSFSVTLKSDTYTVTFVTFDNLEIKKTFKKGEEVTSPELEEVTGYSFISWDKELSSIDKDETVKAIYMINTYTVKFVDEENKLLKEEVVEYNESATAPSAPLKEGYTFVSWDKDYTNVEEDITVKAIYEKSEYTVRFVDEENNLLKEEVVEYNESATAPNAPLKEGYTFISWDKDYKNVKSDLRIKPVYQKNDQELKGIKVVPTHVNIDPMKDSGNAGVYLVRKGINPNLTSAGGTTEGSSLAYWSKLAINYNSNGYYEIVSIMAVGNSDYQEEYTNADFKIVFYSSCASEAMAEAFEKAYVGQKIVFTNIDLETGELKSGAEILFVEETIEATEVSIAYITLKGTVDGKITLAYVLTPANSNTEVIWESSDETIATVTDGIVSLLKEGTVRIRAIAGTASDEVEITVAKRVESNYKSLDGNIASGYVYTNYDKVDDLLFDTLDIIYCAFLLVDPDGTFFSGASKSTNEKYLNRMTTYILPKAKEKGCYSVFSIGGGGQSDSFSDIAASALLRKVFINNIIEVINTYGFDGVDIDWEVPKAAEKANFTLLMKELYAAVKANNPNHLVTAAIGGGKWQPPCYDLVNSQQYMDYINMMTYGMVNEAGRSHCALHKSTTFADITNKIGKTLGSCSIEESVVIYNSYGIPNNKIIIGLSFYGMKQKRTYDSTSSTWSAWVADGTSSYTALKNLIGNGYTEHYDTYVGAPYIINDAKTSVIFYDNPRSIKEKCEYVIAEGLAGVMYWQNGQDTTGDLLTAIKESFNK